MTVSSRVTEEQDVVEIEVSGRFDFSLQKGFRDAYREYPAGMSYRVDLSRVDYLDSAALGMLLLLRQHAGDGKSSVTLCRPSQAVDKILKVANFHRIFDID
jgi:anti-anti-sigma factor